MPHEVDAVWRVDVFGGRRDSAVGFGIQAWFQSMAGPFTNDPYIRNHHATPIPTLSLCGPVPVRHLRNRAIRSAAEARYVA